MSRSIGRSSQYQSYDDSDPLFLASHLAIILMIFFITFIFSYSSDFIQINHRSKKSFFYHTIVMLTHSVFLPLFSIFHIIHSVLVPHRYKAVILPTHNLKPREHSYMQI